jgi:hypothetical protein
LNNHHLAIVMIFICWSKTQKLKYFGTTVPN